MTVPDAEGVPPRFVPSTLPSGRQLLLAATDLRIEEPPRARDVAFRGIDFADVSAVLSEVTTELGQALRSARPDEATVELGLALDAKTGRVAALLIEGGGQASLKVKLRWRSNGSAHDGD